MEKNIGISYGLISDTIYKQINKQGFSYKEMKISEIQGLSKPIKGTRIRAGKDGETLPASNVYYYKHFSIEIFRYDGKFDFFISPVVFINEYKKLNPEKYILFDIKKYADNSLFHLYYEIRFFCDTHSCEMLNLTNEKKIVNFAVFLIDYWIVKYLEGNENHPLLVNDLKRIEL